MKIVKPTLILDKEKSIRNIERMVKKAKRSDVKFRPHFKTHQSAQIGEWFRNFGVESITVSSLDMAVYFAGNGWKDITVAFPVNILEIDKINELAKEIQLNLLVESKEVVIFLRENIKFNVNVWIKIDVGYKRAGIAWNDFDEVVEVAKEIENSSLLSFSGLLTHSGHTYKAKSKEEIKKIYLDTISRMKEVQKRLESENLQDVKLSVGDTPSCLLMDNFNDVDEIRPGNFVFCDVEQFSLGSCSEEDIAIAVACPVVAKHKNRNEIIIHGGGVHLSKDFILKEDNAKLFGYISLLEQNGWSPSLKNAYVSSLSQEHGIVKADDNFFNQVHIGDILMVLPVHSCLTANLMKRYLTLDGEMIESAGI